MHPEAAIPATPEALPAVPESAPAITATNGNLAPGQTVTGPVLVTPTQVRRPWRSTARSVFQMVVALASLLPLVVTGVYQDADQAPAAVGQVLVVAGAITRVMAMPQVEKFLRRF